jgi:hypothetical protein
MGKRQGPDIQEDFENRLRGAMTYFNFDTSLSIYLGRESNIKRQY